MPKVAIQRGAVFGARSSLGPRSAGIPSLRRSEVAASITLSDEYAVARVAACTACGNANISTMAARAEPGR